MGDALPVRVSKGLRRQEAGVEQTMDSVSSIFEIIGVGVIAGGFVVALAHSWSTWSSTREAADAYEAMRRVFGKAVLLGLEVLVAADIIRTVAVAPTIENLMVLGLLVLVRTFLSFSLDVELDGAWPWRRAQIARERDSGR